MSRRSRLLCASLVVSGAFTACDSPDVSESRLIDRLCEREQCVTEGSARRVQGLTPDSVGFELGPAPGSVVFHFPTDVEPRFSNAAVEVLIEGEGVSSLGTLSPNYEWRSVQTDTPGGARPEMVRIEVAGARAKIADLRLIDLWVDDAACSVSAPGRARDRRR
jgi:hypothetical protein